VIIILIIGRYLVDNVLVHVEVVLFLLDEVDVVVVVVIVVVVQVVGDASIKLKLDTLATFMCVQLFNYF
jgi:hypothetical protein